MTETQPEERSEGRDRFDTLIARLQKMDGLFHSQILKYPSITRSWTARSCKGPKGCLTIK